MSVGAPVLKVGQVLGEGWTVERQLGSGAQAQVFLVSHNSTKRRGALKMYKRRRDCAKENKILRRLSSPRCVGLIGSSENDGSYSSDDSMVYLNSDRVTFNQGLVTELANCGDLFHLVNNNTVLSEKVAKFLVRQILLGIRDCHRQGVVHRDIKLENILISKESNRPNTSSAPDFIRCDSPDRVTSCIYKLEGLDIGKEDENICWEEGEKRLPTNNEDESIFSVKIADFGLSEIMDSPLSSSGNREVGTAGYLAPETYFGPPTMASDVWSLGVCSFIMVGGVPPFVEATREDPWFKPIRQGKFDLFWKWHSRYLDHPVSDEFKKFFSKIFVIDPKKRATVDELLNDPWLAETANMQDVDEAILNYVKCTQKAANAPV